MLAHVLHLAQMWADFDFPSPELRPHWRRIQEIAMVGQLRAMPFGRCCTKRLAGEHCVPERPAASGNVFRCWRCREPASQSDSSCWAGPLDTTREPNCLVRVPTSAMSALEVGGGHRCCCHVATAPRPLCMRRAAMRASPPRLMARDRECDSPRPASAVRRVSLPVLRCGGSAHVGGGKARLGRRRDIGIMYVGGTENKRSRLGFR